ncbi:triose-phosphate isomerase [Alicyclobacillus ferrooxydans]|uniref:Triosephosphate isomerase n=1 Tax=Alicyclobacillus ferrooxydans TaxID=471514 RepID=A0A0N8PPY4_9BACL|nr:triose-phosphate isomerase [Alicyclobacillus ferrooxydans]KPV45613.1 triosephosphate isomerase [Alicyclobacillus ferrooxydans]
MTRRKMLVGNWKMYKTIAETRSFAEVLGRNLGKLSAEMDFAVCPPFTALQVAKVVLPTQVAVGAQNMHQSKNGAFTGEVAAPMLQEIGVKYVVLGHSERRQMFAETDEAVRDKVEAAQEAGFIPILCVGENDAERNSGETMTVVARQTQIGLEKARPDGDAIVIAYEPVWAIGTGKTPSPKDAEKVIAAIREVVVVALGETEAAKTRILYGGSVKPANIAEFVAEKDIDGALVGGASLDPESFVAMAEAMGQVSGR